VLSLSQDDMQHASGGRGSVRLFGRGGKDCGAIHARDLTEQRECQERKGRRVMHFPPWQVAENIPEHRLAHRIVGGVIAGCVPKRDRRSTEPAHPLFQPVPPLCAEFVLAVMPAISSPANSMKSGGGARRPMTA
jgi:hypothetical protein